MSSPAKVIEVDALEAAPESDAEGAASAVIPKAKPQPVDFEGAGVSESAIAEALTLAARAGRWDVVAALAGYGRFK